MKNYIKKFITVLVLILGPVVIALSQPNPPAPDPGFGPGQWSPVGHGPVLTCPIDNGYYILLALAFAYGIYKIWQMKKAEKLA